MAPKVIGGGYADATELGGVRRIRMQPKVFLKPVNNNFPEGKLKKKYVYLEIKLKTAKLKKALNLCVVCCLPLLPKNSLPREPAKSKRGIDPSFHPYSYFALHGFVMLFPLQRPLFPSDQLVLFRGIVACINYFKLCSWGQFRGRRRPP